MSCLKAIAATAVTVFSATIFLQERGDDASPVEQAKRNYREGPIDAAVFERRSDIVVEPRN